MTNKKSVNIFSRREFIGSVMLASTGAALLSGCNTSRWQIGCYTRPWARHDYRVAFDGIAGAGFKNVGLMTSATGLVISRDTTPEQVEDISQEARSRGLEIASIYGGGFEVRKSIDDGIVELERIIDNSAGCGCPELLLGGISSSELTDTYYKIVAECCDYAAGKGVGITIKPHGGTNATGMQCRKLIEKVGHKNFRLWYDPGNIYYYSDGTLDPVDDAADVDGIVAGMCVKDFRLPKDVNVTPGTGMVDFPGVLARLRQGGFTGGPLIVECLSPGDLDFTNAEAGKTREFLEELTG